MNTPNTEPESLDPPPRVQDPATVAITEFHKKNSVEGRMFRYMRGRVTGFWSRQIVTILGSSLLFFGIAPFLGLATLILAMATDGGECLYLRYLKNKFGPEPELLNYRIITAATGGAQILGQLACISLAWIFAGEELRFFVATFLAGAALNAGLVHRFHVLASQIKMVLIISITIFLMGYDLWFYGTKTETILESFAIVMLGYIVFVFLQFIQNYQQRHYRSDLEALEIAKNLSQTANTLAEKEVVLSKMADVAQYSRDMIIIRDQNGNITWVNDVYCRSVEFSAAELLGHRNPRSIVGPQNDPEIVQQATKSIQSGVPFRFEFQFQTKSMACFWADVNISPLFDDAGGFRGTIATARDISQAKEQNRMVLQAKQEAEQAASAKANFLATMSHEIRTPLNGIIGMADLLMQTKLNPSQAEYTKTIVDSGEGLLSIINDILDFSKLDAGKMQIEYHPMDLHSDLDGVRKLLLPIAQEKGITFELDLHPDLPQQISCDSGRLRQILLNLCGNAIKFTQSGGVTLRAMHIVEESGAVKLDLVVQDTGIGIPKDKLGAIFDNFTQAEQNTTRNFGGTGLGLAIARKLAVQMGGDITVNSTLGKGSVFRIKLDASLIQEVKKKPKLQTTHSHSIKGRHILIAEDNMTNQKLIKAMLRPTGAKITFANDGLEAVSKFQKLSPELILMDLSMPNKNGLDATSDIRVLEKKSHQEPCPIVALTANAFAEDREACLKAGMNGFLTKPIRKKVLIDEICSHI